MAFLLNGKDRGLLMREVAEFPDGVTSDFIVGFTINGKKYVRNKRGSTFTTEELGIYANGLDMTSKLQNVCNHPMVKTIIFDCNETGEILINGSLDCKNKTFKFSEGTKIVGSGTISNIKIDAGVQEIFGNDILVNGFTSKKGSIYPQWWGAIGNDVNDDGPAFNRMFNSLNYLSGFLPKVEIPALKYYVSTTINLPDATIGSGLFLEINGYGSQFRTDQPITIFKRIKTDWAATTVMDKYNCSIKGIKFIGSSFFGARSINQTAINIGACYSWYFSDLQISNFDDGFVAEFFLNCKFENIRFTRCTNIGLIGRYGSWTGASMYNSAFNANKLSGLRFDNADNSFASIKLQAADQNIITNCVSEGRNPQYNFYVDYENSTGVNINTFENIWIESVGGTITQNTNFFLRTKGTTILKNIQRIYPNQFFDISQLHSASYVLIDGLPYAGNRPTSGLKFFNAGSTLSGRRIKFDNIQFADSDFIKDPANWDGGFVPQNLELEFTLQANGGTVDYNKGIKYFESEGGLIFKSRYNLAVPNQYMTFHGSMNFAADNTYNIGGNQTTNLRPARVSANRFLADVASTYGFGFGDNSANPVEYINRPEAGVMRFNATGGIDLPIGTTAQRPTGVKRRLRYNSDLDCIEWYNGTVWIQIGLTGSTYNATGFGITSGTDQTTLINSALSNANLKTLVFDLIGGGDITVNGSITVPAGKILKIANGTKIIGTGTITNAKIDAGIYPIFSTSINLVDADSMLGFFPPEWWGAVGDNTNDDTAAMQSCLNAAIRNTGGFVKLMPNKNYKITSVSIENYKEGMPIFTIDGCNAKITVDGANTGFVKNVTTQTSADQEVNSRMEFRNIRFVGSGVAGCKAVRIAPTYGTQFNMCNFINFDTAVELRFCLNALMIHCKFQNSISYDVIMADGDWTGATGNNSQTNQTKMINCRHYCKSGQLAAVRILKTSGVVLDDCIYEGGNPVRNIEFNSTGSTTVQHLNIIRPHVENAPTSESILLETPALVCVEQYWSQLGHTAIRTQGSSTPKIIFRNPKYLIGDNLKFASSNVGGGAWWFEGMDFELLGDYSTFWSRKFIVDSNHVIPFYKFYNTNTGLMNVVQVMESLQTRRLVVSGDIAQFYNNVYNKSLTYLEGNTYLSNTKSFIFTNDGGQVQSFQGTSTYVQWYGGNRYVMRVHNDGRMTLGWGGTPKADVDMSGARTPLIPPSLATSSFPAASGDAKGMFAYDLTANMLRWSNGTQWYYIPISGGEAAPSGGTGGTPYGAIRLFAATSGGSNETTMTPSDESLLVDTTNGNVIVRLESFPNSAPVNIKKISFDANYISIVPYSGTIDGSAAFTIDMPNDSLMLKSYDGNFYSFKY